MYLGHSCMVKQNAADNQTINLDHIDDNTIVGFSELAQVLVPLALLLLPPAPAVEVIKTEPSMCDYGCVSVCLLALSLLNRLTQGHQMVQGLTLMTSRTGLMVKIIGQSSRSSS